MTSVEYDTIVVGSGPAGYTAAIYSLRAGLNTLLLEGKEYGGQLTTTDIVENYPGFSKGINGIDLMMEMRSQCQGLISSGGKGEIKSEIAIGLSGDDGNFQVKTEEDEYSGKTVIIATGATAKKLDIPHGEVYWNHGISACAVCDGALPMFRKKPLIVVGGGDSACEEAMFLSRFGSKIYMLVRSDKMRASKIMKERVLNNPKIEILFNTTLIDVAGEKGKVSHAILRGPEEPEEPEDPKGIECNGVFYAIGHRPNVEWLKSYGKIELDSDGYIITKNTHTSVPGIFACGDVQDKIYRQAITAAGSGCMAALEVERYLF